MPAVRACRESVMDRNRIFIAGLVTLEIMILFLGCQGDSNSPITPGQTVPGNQNSDSPDLSGNGAPRTAANTPVLWGLYSVSYNNDLKSFEVIPLRGPTFAVNVVHFMQPPAGSQFNMDVDILDDSEIAENGTVDVRVNLHHPFPGQEQYTGFDVCGVFISEGSLSSNWNASLTYAEQSQDPVVLNPDGYTRWMNPTEFLTGNIFGFVPGYWGTSESSENSGFLAGATLNPYKYFAQMLGPGMTIVEWLEEPESVSNRGMFPPGATCSRDYELQFPMKGGVPEFMFDYAILANWAEPTVAPVVDPLSDFPPEANAQWPLHVIVTDNSEVYFTPDLAGGVISFEMEIFDWDAFSNPGGVPGEVTGFKVWSDDPLVPGGNVSFMSDEGDWNSGFVASTSVVSFDIPDAVPQDSGDSYYWIEIESANPNSYDQGFDCELPSDPLATYVKVPLEIANCPKAFMSTFSKQKAGKNSVLDDVVIGGEKFIDGNDLGVWLELKDKDGEIIHEIVGTDVQLIDSGSITADFDFTGAPYGTYKSGCVNGCGAVTTPEDQFAADKNMGFEVVIQTPVNLHLSSDRSPSEPSEINTMTFSWDSVADAEYYTVYYQAFNPDGNPATPPMSITVTKTFFTLPIYTVLPETSGAINAHVTAYGGDGQNNSESPASHGVCMMLHSIESGLGAWKVVAENEASIKFARSSVNSKYSGAWGMKTLGFFPWYPSLWAMFTTPQIPMISGTTTVKFEFLHRHLGILPTNGYQAGWCNELPPAGSPEVAGYHPFVEAAYGCQYNDFDSPALQTEFKISNTQDSNFSTNLSSYSGWYISGFDASEMLTGDTPGYLVIGVAGNYYDLLELNIDDVAVLIY